MTTAVTAAQTSLATRSKALLFMVVECAGPGVYISPQVLVEVNRLFVLTDEILNARLKATV